MTLHPSKHADWPNPSRVLRLMALPIAGVFVLGFVILFTLFQHEQEEERGKLIQDSFVAANNLHPEYISHLAHAQATVEEKKDIQKGLDSILTQSGGSIEYASLFVVQDGVIRTLAENQGNASPLAFPPELIHQFSQNTPFTYGPFQEFHGNGISVFHPTPFSTPEGQPIWVDLDMRVGNWILKVILDILSEICATILGMLLILVLIYTYLSNTRLHRQLLSDRFFLDTVAESSRSLFKPGLDAGMAESFEIISRAFQADRISCFRYLRTEEGDKKYARLEVEWIRPGICSERKTQAHKHPTIHISATACQKLLMPGAALSDTAKNLGIADEVTPASLHVMLLPLQVEENPYGFLLLESLQPARLSSYEMDALHTYRLALQGALDRRQKETQMHLFRLAIHASGTGMMITDAREQRNPIIYVNHAFLETTGLHEDEILGKTLGESAITAILPSAIHSLEKAMSLDTPYTEVHPLKIASSRPRWIETNLSSLRNSNGELVHHLLTIIDISDLQEAILTAQKASEVKMLFLANMSHEIRTPMNSVLGMSELLLQQPLPEPQRHYCEIILKSANNLVAIVNDILEISKIEAGRLSIRKSAIDLMECIESALQICSMNAASKGLDLFYFVERNVPRLIPTDGVRLRQVLINLISNAVKFTESGKVEVHASLGPLVAGKLRLIISVRDTGIGIPKEQQTQLFEAFKQVDSTTTRQYGGTGLGLAISRRLINLMDGEITLTSTLGHGSDFEFFLPLTPPIETGWSELTGPLKNRSLLLVGSSTPGYQDFFENFCKTQEMLLTFLDDLPETADPANLYDFLILDERMIHADTCPTQRRLKPFVKVDTGKTILLATTSTPQHPKPACSKDFDAVLVRPISLSHLADWLHSLSINSVLPPLQTADHPLMDEVQTPPFQGKKVLIVDDNQMNCLVATEQIKQFGCYVTSAGSGQEALKTLEESEYDIIFLDCQMPTMDGYETARHIRHVKPHLPIIALTADALPATRKKCLNAGMNDFLTKPLHMQTLRLALTKLLNKSVKARQEHILNRDFQSSPSSPKN